MVQERNIPPSLCALIGILLLCAPLAWAGPPAGRVFAGGPALQIPQPPIPGIPQRPTTPSLPPVDISPGPSLSRKQKSAIVKSNFQKTKKDVAALCKLAQSLQEEIDKSNPNVLSLEVVNKADKIQKLAKKIRNEAKEY